VTVNNVACWDWDILIEQSRVSQKAHTTDNNIAGGWGEGGCGLNIGVINGGGRQIESRDQVVSMHSNHSKSSDITTGKLSVKS